MSKTVVKGGRAIEAALRQFAAQARTDILDEAIERGAATFEAEARQRADSAVPGLGNQVTVAMTRKSNAVKSQIGLDVKQGHESMRGLWAEYGTSPHRIAPKTKKVLVIDGDVVGGAVAHPGAPARPWLTPAFEASHQRALADTEAVMAAALEKVKA